MSLYKDLENSVLSGLEEKAVSITQELIASGPNKAQLRESISAGIFKAIENWDQGIYSSANVLVSIDTYRKIREVLDLSGFFAIDNYLGRVIIATISGNVHILGKTLAGALLEATGFEVIDLGENVPRDKLKQKVTELKPDLLVLGCYTLSGQDELKRLMTEIQALKKTCAFKVIIGGHSTSEELAINIAADARAANIADIAKIAKELI